MKGYTCDFCGNGNTATTLCGYYSGLTKITTKVYLCNDCVLKNLKDIVMLQETK